MTEKFKAFILINTGVVQIKKVSEKLLGFKEIENVHELYGQYDVIVTILSDNRIKAEEFINEKLRPVPGITRIEILVVSETIKEGKERERTGLNESEVYMLFTVKYGKTREVAKKLAEFGDVRRVHELYGQYDIVIKLKKETNKELEDFIQKKIRTIKNIEDTETLLVSDVP